jgi:hypothetical protein
MIVDLRNCATASDKFRKALDLALQETDGSQRLVKLSEVFRDFGQIVPRTVDIGAAFYFVWSTATKSVSTGQQLEMVARAALSAKIGVEGSVDASAEFADGLGTKVTADSLKKKVHTRAFGGNVKKLDADGNIDGSAWFATIDDPDLWAIIGRREFIPLTEFLPQDTQQKIKDAWDAAVADAWGGRPPKNPAYVLPDFHGTPPDFRSKPFTLSTSAGTEVVLTASAVPGELNGTSPSSRLAAAVDEGLTWELKYTNQCTTDQDDGTPLYWVLEHQSPAVQARRVQAQRRVDAENASIAQMGDDVGLLPRPADRVALAAISHSGNWFAGALDAASVLNEPAVGSHAVWSVAPADPSRFDPRRPNKYVITNHQTGLVLGELTTGRDLTPDGSEMTAAKLVAAPADVDLANGGPTAWLVRLYDT